MRQRKSKAVGPRVSDALDLGIADELASLFKALADTTRLRLLGALCEGERCVHELTTQLQLEQSAISHQLRVLRDRQIVRHRKEGRHVFYRLGDDQLRELVELGLGHLERAGRSH